MKIALVGYGSEIRSDDRLGIEVAKDFQDYVDTYTGLNAVDLIGIFDKYDKIILVDAGFIEGEYGSHIRITYDEFDFPQGSSFSHDMNFSSLVPMAKELGISVPEIVFFLMKPRILEIGENFSDEVRKNYPGLVKKIRNEIKKETFIYDPPKD